jgi:predicted small lipoprotein YifL
MKFVILLLLIGGPLYFPFDDRLTCHEQGYELMTSIAKHQVETPKVQQGWYTDHGDLVYGFYCE